MFMKFNFNYGNDVLEMMLPRCKNVMELYQYDVAIAIRVEKSKKKV